MIKLENIEKVYGKGEALTKALNGITLHIKEGEFIAIMGPSGSGKSTLLNIIGCLDTHTGGNYILDNKNITKYSSKELARLRRDYFGFIVQYFALVEDYTVFENVKVPLDYKKVTRKNKKDKIITMLKKLEIENKKHMVPCQLSGGQNQRVAIARALINDPSIILADEPTGALDKNNAKQVMELLKQINSDGKTVIIVTHDENVANQCRRILKIEDGEIVEDINIC